MTEEDSGNATNTLVETDVAFREFVANRSEATYNALVEAFVFEAMGTKRAAWFPLNQEALEGLAEKDGGLHFGFAIVRDPQGIPYATFLTSHEMKCGPYPMSAEIVASYVITQFLFREQDIAGIALNPWNDGGAFIPKNLFLQAMVKIEAELGAEEKRTRLMSKERLVELDEYYSRRNGLSD